MLSGHYLSIYAEHADLICLTLFEQFYMQNI